MNKKKLIGILLVIVSLLIPKVASFAENVFIEANKQNFNGEKNITTFEGNVKVRTENITVQSPKAEVLMDKAGKATNATFFDNPKATKINGVSKSEVKANIIKLSLLNNIIYAEGSVKSIVSENSETVVTIKADSQEFDMKTNIVRALGNVVINYEGLETHSKQANIYVDKNGGLSKVRLLGNAEVIQEKGLIKANDFLFNPKTNEMIAIGNTYSQSFLQGGVKVAVWSDYQQYDKQSGTLMTSGNVKISYIDYIATGPKASFIPNPKTSKVNKILFSGRSKIQQSDRVVEADKIEITVDPKNFSAEGNVKTKFTQLNDYKNETNL